MHTRDLLWHWKIQHFTTSAKVSNMSSFTVTTALFQSLTSDLDEIIMAVDGIELHLVFGDITNETTDAIVNTTDFKDFQTAGIHADFLI